MRTFLYAGFVLLFLSTGSTRAANTFPPRVTDIALNKDYSVGIEVLEDGTLMGWGDSAYALTSPPKDLGPVFKVALDYAKACAITLSGVRCWGYGPNSEYFSGVERVPADLKHPTEIAVGTFGACAIDDGQVRCWGDGQIALPPAFKSAHNLVATNQSACAIDGGQLKCWGESIFGMPKDLGFVTAVSMFARTDHSIDVCAISGKRIRCWSAHGEYFPTSWPSLTNPTQIAVGHYFSCAVSDEGLTCWSNRTDYPDWGSNFPSFPKEIGTISKIAMGGYSGCVLNERGQTSCWSWDLPAPPFSPDVCDLKKASGRTARVCDGETVKSLGVVELGDGAFLSFNADSAGGLRFTRCLGDRQPDYAFGTYGTSFARFDYSRNIEVRPYLAKSVGNKILIVGEAGYSSEGNLFVARLDQNLILDQSFGEAKGASIVMVGDHPPTTQADLLDVLEDGTIVVNGKASHRGCDDFRPFSKTFTPDGKEIR